MSNSISEQTNTLLLSYVRTLFKEQINSSSDSYTIGCGSAYRSESELDSRVGAKYGCELYLVDKRTYDAPIRILLGLTDGLGDVFREYEIAPFLLVDIENGEEDYVEFTSPDDLVLIKKCRPLSFFNKDEEWHKNFNRSVSKATMFAVIRST